jgi:hypothetical protein
MNKTVKATVTLPEFEGFEYTGEVRELSQGDHYLDLDVFQPEVAKWTKTYTSKFLYVVMRPVPTWRDARPSDLENGPVRCRCRDTEKEEWQTGYLCAYMAKDPFRFGISRADGKLEQWSIFCQVQDNA